MDHRKPPLPRISIVDIAERTGVSPATVSRVFNYPDRVQARTRETVLSVAQGLGYRPNASARTLRTQRSQVLGIVLPTLDNPVFAECLQGMAAATAQLGYAIMPVTTQYQLEAEEEAVQQLLSFGVDGVLLVVSDAASSRALALLQQQSVPYVLVYNRHDTQPCVSVAGETAMHDIVHALVELGHQHIAMICGRLSASDRAQQRHHGFCEAMARAALTPRPLIEVPFIETAIQDISEVLSQPGRPTALVCSNDLIALRAMRAAHECGLNVPTDISITGFDGIGLCSDLTPRLSTVAQPNAEMGRAAVAWLLESLTHRRAPAARDSITLPYHVRWAESCASAPKLSSRHVATSPRSPSSRP